MGILTGTFDFLVDNPYLIFVGILLYVFIFALSVLFSAPKPGPNPFKSDRSRPREKLVLDTKQRDKVLKQGFTQQKVPENLDAIVIGSGMGGLAAAHILARVGKKVLVLEQHDQAGGCLHTFVDKGFEFDVGIHYIGEMRNNTLLRHLVDQLTEGQLEWCDLDDDFDMCAIGDPAKPRKYLHMAGQDAWLKQMLEYFPDEEKAIKKYLEMLKDVRKQLLGMVGLKMLPKWLAKLLIKTGLSHLMTKYFRYGSRSLKSVLDELTDNKDLQTVLAYNFGDYGTEPSSGSFAMHAILVNHFMYGSSYPKGGSSEFAYHMIPTIEQAGGRVLVRAPVTEILTNDKGRAVGVRVQRSSGDVDIFAKKIISDAGVVNTFKTLLPKQIAAKTDIYRLLEKKRVVSGAAGMSLFVGLKGTAEELGLKAQNIWAFTDNDVARISSEFFNQTAEEAMEQNFPLLFISFPSAKDPTFNDRYPGRSVCTVVTFCNWKWFEKWENGRVKKRGEEYEILKDTMAKRIWEQVLLHFPQLADKVEFMDCGSPVSNKYYIASDKGQFYGLDHTTDRFGSPEVTMTLRPQTEIPGLYLTGQDIMSCGFAGALMGGVLCTSAILNRNLYQDMAKLKAKIGNKWDTKKTN